MIYRSGLATFSSRGAGMTREQAVDAHWRLVLEMDQLTRVERAVLQGFVLELMSGDHNFTMQDYSYVRRGSGAGTPLVNGANQTGPNIITDGWTASQTGVLLAGDQVQLGLQLCVVTADVSSNGSGQATIPVRPAVRKALADNASINTSAPLGRWKLVDNEFSWETMGGTVRSNFVLECVEDMLA